MRYFEDFEPGQTLETGEYELSRRELVTFARMYDPQPFHVDEQAARDSPFGGLVASGWHTTAIFMRLYVEAVLLDTAGMGSPGVERIRWLVPVRPGDVLRGRATIAEATPSETRPDRGTIVNDCELLNQRDEVVLTMRVRGFVARRDSRIPGS
jgi:acyl dehydratase